MESEIHENASERKTYVSVVYDEGAKHLKNEFLHNINPDYSKLHYDGYIHIHDLEAYGQTYNCLTMDLHKNFPIEKFKGYSDTKKIIELFSHFRKLIAELGHEQSGGIAFPNFDIDVSSILSSLNVKFNCDIEHLLGCCIESMMDWLNDSHERCGQFSYYTTLNLGLATDDIGRFVTKSVLGYFGSPESRLIKPNIIFKVKSGKNRNEDDPNHDLYLMATEITARKMIPTYLLFDSEPNKDLDPEKIAIMGCRTRVVQNEYGDDVTIGRGNIAYITINLPRLALDVLDEQKNPIEIESMVSMFMESWVRVADVVKDILLDRYQQLLQHNATEFPCNYSNGLWIEDFQATSDLEDVFKNGTLSIGFIGLAEAIELLVGKKIYESEIAANYALKIVEYFREVIDGYRKQYHMNFSLLATSGEFISGRFPSLDQEKYSNQIINKAYYTNSFHVEVDSKIHPYDKLRIEGPYHKLCNGGCISYVEFASAPLTNVEAINEIIEIAIENGVSYLGINFPIDICKKCDETGVFDTCTNCGGIEILRIRRVSGYLENLEYFTEGKKAEVSNRKPNESR